MRFTTSAGRAATDPKARTGTLVIMPTKTIPTLNFHPELATRSTPTAATTSIRPSIVKRSPRAFARFCRLTSVPLNETRPPPPEEEMDHGPDKSESPQEEENDTDDSEASRPLHGLRLPHASGAVTGDLSLGGAKSCQLRLITKLAL